MHSMQSLRAGKALLGKTPRNIVALVKAWTDRRCSPTSTTGLSLYSDDLEFSREMKFF